MAKQASISQLGRPGKERERVLSRSVTTKMDSQKLGLHHNNLIRSHLPRGEREDICTNLTDEKTRVLLRMLFHCLWHRDFRNGLNCCGLTLDEYRNKFFAFTTANITFRIDVL